MHCKSKANSDIIESVGLGTRRNNFQINLSNL